MLRYLKKYWLLALLTPALMIVEVITDLWQPILMRTIVDDGVLGLSTGGVGDLSLILHTGLLMLLCVAAGAVAGTISGILAGVCSQRFGNDIRKDAFRHVMGFSFRQAERFSTGSLVTRVTNDVTQMQDMVAQSIRYLARNIVLFIGAIFCLTRLHISFGVTAMIAFPILAVFILCFIRRVIPNYAVLQKRLDRVNQVIQENVTGIRVVKAYTKEAYEEQRFGKANGDMADTQLHILRMMAMVNPILNIVLNITVVILIYLGMIHVRSGEITPGNVMAGVTYLSQLVISIMAFASIFQVISRGQVSWKRLKELIDTEPELADGNNVIPAEGTAGCRVEFSNVTFSYSDGNGIPTLRDIDLTVEPGETLGVLGATGSGKSSLVNLIPRFYDVTAGSVRLDGVDVRDYPLETLRERVAIALQKSELFSVRIRDNIRWGDPDATDAQIEQAARSAQAAEFIVGQPEGFDTLVAEKGMSLSGGQKQRLSVSRALLKKAGLLILDDATSALDLKTEANLHEALRTQYAGVTKIIIAQRIASVMKADRIAVMDEGRIVACDTHENLMKDCTLYQEIYNLQLKGNDAAEGKETAHAER